MGNRCKQVRFKRVLLKNDNNPLPVREGSVAVVGPNAKADVVTSGGSVCLRPSWAVTPLEGMQQYKQPAGAELSYAFGCKGAKFLPVFGPEFTTAKGKPGFDLVHFAIGMASRPRNQPSPNVDTVPTLSFTTSTIPTWATTTLPKSVQSSLPQLLERGSSRSA